MWHISGTSEAIVFIFGMHKDWANSNYDFFTSVWPSRSKIGRGQKVGQSKIFSNHGLWHTKMTGMKSRMQNCHSWLSNFSHFEKSAILFFLHVIQWGQIHENDKVQCQLFQYWINSNGSMVDQYIQSHDAFIPCGQNWPWPLTLETRSPNVKNT